MDASLFDDLLESEAIAPPDDETSTDELTLSTDTYDRDPDWPHCEVCGVAIDWSGRGRRPKKCETHRRRVANAGTTRRAAGRSIDQRADRIQKSLDVQAFKFGAMISRVVPVTGTTIMKRSEKTSAALVTIARRKPEYLDALEKVAEFEHVMDLAEFVAAILAALAVDFNQMNPDGFAAKALGVTETYHELMDDGNIEAPVVQEEARVSGLQFGPGPLPTFQPIGVGVE